MCDFEPFPEIRSYIIRNHQCIIILLRSFLVNDSVLSVKIFRMYFHIPNTYKFSRDVIFVDNQNTRFL